MPPTSLLGVLYLLAILVWDIILYKLGLRKKPRYARTEEEEAEMMLRWMQESRPRPVPQKERIVEEETPEMIKTGNESGILYFKENWEALAKGEILEADLSQHVIDFLNPESEIEFPDSSISDKYAVVQVIWIANVYFFRAKEKVDSELAESLILGARENLTEGKFYDLFFLIAYCTYPSIEQLAESSSISLTEMEEKVSRLLNFLGNSDKKVLHDDFVNSAHFSWEGIMVSN